MLEQALATGGWHKREFIEAINSRQTAMMMANREFQMGRTVTEPPKFLGGDV